MGFVGLTWFLHVICVGAGHGLPDYSWLGPCCTAFISRGKGSVHLFVGPGFPCHYFAFQFLGPTRIDGAKRQPMLLPSMFSRAPFEHIEKTFCSSRWSCHIIQIYLQNRSLSPKKAPVHTMDSKPSFHQVRTTKLNFSCHGIGQ